MREMSVLDDTVGGEADVALTDQLIVEVDILGELAVIGLTEPDPLVGDLRRADALCSVRRQDSRERRCGARLGHSELPKRVARFNLGCIFTT
jgi:hypothetical protein